MRAHPSAIILAVLLVSLVSASGATLQRVTPAAPVVTPSGVRFVLMRSEARSVALAGSFNQWSASSHPLVREAKGALWSIVVRLSPGQHAFMFVVDGVWVSPPLAEDYVDDGFGAKNGIVVVR